MATANDSFQKTLSSYDNQYTFPKTVGGSDSTYLCDKFYYSSGLRGLRVGGAYSNGSFAGLFYWFGGVDSGDANARIGGRCVSRFRGK